MTVEAGSPSEAFEGLLSRSPQMHQLFAHCIRVAPTLASVLILGETGTGKELIARAIHARSGRRGRFVAVDCGAVPETLIEAELFGHEKGSFTGADTRREGLFRAAHRGTLLLDEVGNLPSQAQASLLRALQEGHVRPVGSQEEVPVDVRVVAATSVPLDVRVRDGAFREDLLYRLDVIRIVLPPLRQRPEDVAYLFERLLERHGREHGVEPLPQPTEEFLAALEDYPWPGNVRQLENLAERLVLTRPGRVLAAEDLRLHLHRAEPPEEMALDAGPAAPPEPSPLPELAVDLGRSLQEFMTPYLEALERAYLERALEETGGRIQETAEIAKLSRRTLQRKLKRYGLDKSDFR